MAFSIRNPSPSKWLAAFLVISLMEMSLASKVPERPKEKSSRYASDMVAAGSVSVSNYKIQSVAPRSSSATGSRGYGYPYLIAPTLPPFIKARSDDFENEAVHEPISPAKSYGSRMNSKDETILKKSAQKKSKVPYTYGATRRQSYDEDSSSEKRLESYREPKYRNFDELETRFRPRRIDINVPYSRYGYSNSPSRPVVSQRDPYLTPGGDATDGFYPKVNRYPSTYGQSGQQGVAYGAGRYEDPNNYHSEHIHGGNYGLSGSYGPSNSYGQPPAKYPSNGGHYGYQEDYAIESNKPIIGDIRKRLLDYAGASDLYEGEPDYLREVARNKHKYGSLGNDYYSYGGPGHRNSYRDFPYVESKISLVKKPRSQ